MATFNMMRGFILNLGDSVKCMGITRKGKNRVAQGGDWWVVCKISDDGHRALVTSVREQGNKHWPLFWVNRARGNDEDILTASRIEW